MKLSRNDKKRLMVLSRFILLTVIMINIVSLELFSDDKCGHYNCISCISDKIQKRKIIEKFQNDESRPPSMAKTNNINSMIVVHYDTSGVNSVDLTDNNKNGIPDYIDSVEYYFDFAYDIEINHLAYKKPLIDSGRGGDNRLDIYVKNLVTEDDYVYGYTVSEDLIELDNNVVTANSYIVIDNDYSAKDSVIKGSLKIPAFKTTGIQGLKVTAAHELHHAIQYAYSVSFNYSSLLMEMTSVWVEQIVHNNLFDYYQYLPELFSKINEFPLILTDDYMNGYRWSIFLIYLSKSYGNDIIKDIWDSINKGKDAFTGIDFSLKNRNSSLSESWNNFIPWLYYTSTRTIDSLYFNSAAIYPKIKLLNTDYLKNQLQISGSVIPFQIETYKILNQDISNRGIESFDVIVSYSVDKVDENINELNYNLDFSTEDIYENKLNYSNSITYKSSFNSGGKGLPVVHIFINDGTSYSDESYVMPNPVNPDLNNVFVALPIELPIVEYNVFVYDAEMNQIYSKKHQNERYNGMNGISIPGTNFINNGIYFYNITNENKDYFGKFAILKK